jgi:hypothetical protein
MSTEVRATERPTSLFQMWIFGVVWCGVTGLVSIPIVTGYETRFFPTVIAGVFAVVGLLLLGAVLWMTLGYLKFGAVLLYVDDPVVIGGQLTGWFHLPNKVTAAIADSQLACRSGMWTSPPNSTYSEGDVWSTTMKLRIHRSSGRNQAEFVFDIPSEHPATDNPVDEAHGSTGVGWKAKKTENNRAYYSWVLSVHVDEPGLDLRRDFRLHVESRSAAPADTQNRQE